MASSSITPPKYDVFLSFKGQDTRQNFTSHLYNALAQAGIKTFMDDELCRCEEIVSSLRRGIEESRISIIILSKNYASSAWCLDELEHILECRRTLSHRVLPVFYNVEPSNFRHQSRSSEVAFGTLKNKFKDDMGKMRRWMVALREVANLSGYHLQNQGHESTIVNIIVKEISNILQQDLSVAHHKIGLGYLAKEVISMLCDESLDFRMVGIYGMGGLGKTTLAKAVYNSISDKFEASCFLANKGENFDPKGILQLQRQFPYEILMVKDKARYNVDMGIKMIEERRCRKRILIVLDSVDKLDQLNHILGDYSWLSSGCRVLITTRSKDLLKTSPLYKQCEVQKLNHDESLELLSWHAFDMVHPIEDYMECAKRVVRDDGIPLALKVLGSALWDESCMEDERNDKHLSLPLKEVTAALREAGLKSPNLIFGIDFSESNEWAGKMSFNNQSLHTISDTPNPYEQVISIIGKTLAPFHDDSSIPCFGLGFGDATTRDEKVFSFQSNFSPCHGYQELLATYRDIVPEMRLAGPTSYAPVIEAAIDIVESSGGQYHVLVIIANGEFIGRVDTNDEGPSPQEEKTIRSIATARTYPLSIVLVRVGDQLWEDTTKLISKIPVAPVGTIDNFQVIVFNDHMSKDASAPEKEAEFAFFALEGIPLQYKAANELGIIGRVMGRAKGTVVCPPVRRLCAICLTNGMDMIFGCGHLICSVCASRLQKCPLCRQPIDLRVKLLN